MCCMLERGLRCALIKSTLGPGNPGGLGIWRERVQGGNGGQRGQFTSNLGLRWTIPVTTGGCQVVEVGIIGGGAMYRMYRNSSPYAC